MSHPPSAVKKIILEYKSPHENTTNNWSLQCIHKWTKHTNVLLHGIMLHQQSFFTHHFLSKFTCWSLQVGRDIFFSCFTIQVLICLLVHHFVLVLVSILVSILFSMIHHLIVLHIMINFVGSHVGPLSGLFIDSQVSYITTQLLAGLHVILFFSLSLGEIKSFSFFFGSNFGSIFGPSPSTNISLFLSSS